jgi:hypothetical protein
MAEAEQVTPEADIGLKLEQLVGHAHMCTCTGIGMRGLLAGLQRHNSCAALYKHSGQ